ncbi:alpha/beta hydrolase [Plantactinospora sp. CA-294935]|uniref:alpha/beta hydrolase n=1 Tax=Plantactinospora sp. CA-294935 TaxID=3240012 RepID=UPI003D8ABAFF
MSGVTFEMVLNADPEAWRKAAAGWDRLGRSTDERADALALSTRRLPDVWESGSASQAAGAHCDGLRKELDSAFPPVLLIAQALAQHGTDVAELSARAEELVEQGRAAHVTINPDGSMTMDPAHANEWTARSMSSLVWQRDALLKEAAELDARTAKAIAENTATSSGTPSAKVDRSSVPAKGTDPADVKKWWDSLSPAQRRYVMSEYPELIGSLDGVPVASRDIANRIVLDRELDGLTQRRADLDAREAHIRAMVEQGRGAELYPDAGNPAGAALAELEKIKEERERIDGNLRGLNRIDDRLEDPGKPRAYLIGLSTADDGRAIVSVGNPDAADNVLTYIPGTGAELSKVGGDIDRADRMALDAKRVDPSQETASLLWLGYDAPDSIAWNAPFDGSAEGGAPELNQFQNGLRATHDGEPSRNVVLGHSYGSTVIGHAATGAGINADAVVFVGSPGVDTNSATELKGVPPQEVWATRAEHDAIKRVPDWDLAHGNDPTREDFGGRVFSSNPGDPDNEGATHSAYWDDGNLARENIAYIVTGQNGKVT